MKYYRKRYLTQTGKLREHELQEAEKYDGISLLFSTKPLSPEEVTRKYFEKDVVEKAFQSLKGVVKIRPVRKWIAERVRAHVFICFLAYLLIAVNLPGLFLYLSIGFYGIVAWSIPSIMTALVGDYVGPHRTVSVFGFITFIFGIGQIAGPYLAGVLAETTGSFAGSFYFASVLAVLGALLSAALPRPPGGH